MPEKWTGDLLGRMHLAGITAKELAAEAGLNDKYVSLLMNGHRNPKGAEAKLNAAFDRLIQRKESV